MPYSNDYLASKYRANNKSKKVVKRVRASSKKQNLKKPRYKVRKLLFVASVLTIIIYFVFGQSVRDNYTVAFSSSSEQIKSIARDAGFSTHGKAIFFRADPELVNADELYMYCPHDDEDSIEYGCYIPAENKIYILEITYSEYDDVEITTAVHEMLHAAWDKLDYSQMEKISFQLNSYFSDTTYPAHLPLRNTLKYYTNDKPTIDNELHSFIGSQIDSKDMSPELAAYYSNYFVEGSNSSDAHKKFTKKMNSKTNYFKSESTYLVNESNNIDRYKSEWLDKIKRHMQSNLYYNDIYTYNRNVDAYNNNLEIYNSKVDAYEIRRIKYNSEVDSFNKVIDTLYPNRTKVKTI